MYSFQDGMNMIVYVQFSRWNEYDCFMYSFQDGMNMIVLCTVFKME